MNPKTVQSLLKHKQDEINNIVELTNKIQSYKSKLSSDISNLNDVLEISEEVKRRYRELYAQISNRYTLLISLDLNIKVYFELILILIDKQC